MNKQSSQKVSDECLGEMLADRFVMWRNSDVVKTASVASAASAAKSGASAFGKGLAFFAAPLAIAGLVHGIGAMVDAHKAKKMEEDAQTAFNKIKKDSEHIKGNPVLAEEAFDAIKTFAPSLAIKPSILKTFIEHTIKTEMLAPQTVSELASAQSNVHKAKTPGFAQGFMGAVDPAFSTGKTLTDEKLQKRMSF